MNLLWLLVVVLLIVALFGAPTWPYARNWGYGWGPSGLIGVLVLVLVVLLLTGRL